MTAPTRLSFATSLVLVLAASLQPSIASADDAADQLKTHCTACHGTEVYTRSNRRIKDRTQLSKQVQRCQLSQDLQWFDDDVEAVADYLNSHYYKF